MFTMPSSTDNLDSVEGMSDDKPIQLKAPFTVAKFDHLLGWFYR